MIFKKAVFNALMLSFLLVHLSCRTESGWAEIFLRKGQVYMKQGEHDLALREYQKAMRINPGNVQALLGAADAYLMMGNCEVAVEEINGASMIDPNIPADYYYKKAQCLLKRNPPPYTATIEEALVKAIKIDPSRPEYYDLIETCYAAAGNTELAAESRDKARNLRLNSKESKTP